MKQASQWARISERGSYTGMRLLVLLYRYGGSVLLSPILYGVVFYFFATRAATRRHSRLYLQRATGRDVGNWQVWRHHLAFGRALTCRVRAWMGRLPAQDVAFPRRDTMWAMKKRGQGVIFLGAHLGNLDMCRTMVEPGSSYKLNIIVHTRNAEKFNRILQQINPDIGINLFQVDQIGPDTAMQLKTRLNDGEAVVLLADRCPAGTEERHYTTEFLGDPAAFPLGPFWLAVLLEAPVYFMTSVETDNGYQVIVEPLRENPEPVKRSQRAAAARELFEAYAAQLEPLCRQYPLQWFNFYDYWQDDLKRSAKSFRSNSSS